MLYISFCTDVFTTEAHEFTVKQNHSYFCKSISRFNLTATGNQVMDMVLTNLQLDVFRTGNSTQYNSGK